MNIHYVHHGDDPDPWVAAHAGELPHDHGEPAPPARKRRRELGIPDDAERARLASRFGAVLRTERGNLTQQELADRAKLDRKTVVRLETGRQRPTTASIWKIARALRGDLRSRVALDERLRACAGDSLRDYGRRPHAARERMRLALRLESGGALPASEEDSLGAQIVAELAVRVSRAEHPAGAPCPSGHLAPSAARRK